MSRTYLAVALLIGVAFIAGEIGWSEGLRCYVGGSVASRVETDNCTICQKVTTSGSAFGVSADQEASTCAVACSESDVNVLGIRTETNCCNTDLCNGASTLAVSLTLAAVTALGYLLTSGALRR